jgi:hypothetical protein
MGLLAVSPLAGAVLDRLVERVAGDDRFVGIYAGGSVGNRTDDEYSDLDLVLVCRSQAHRAIFTELPVLAAEVGPLLAAFTGEHVNEPRLLIVLYGPPPLHVDLKLIGEHDIADRVEDGLVLWERREVVTNAWAVKTAQWRELDLQWIEDRFWVWVHYGAAKIARGELFECLDMLAVIRATVLGPLLAVRAKGRSQRVRRVEQIAPNSISHLAKTIGGHSPQACAAALGAAVQLYRELRDDVSRTRSDTLVRRAEAEWHVVRYLDAVTSTALPKRGREESMDG